MITYSNHERVANSEAEIRHTTFECIFLLRSFFCGGAITGIPRGLVGDEVGNEVANPEECLVVMAAALTDESLRKTRKVDGRDSVVVMMVMVDLVVELGLSSGA
jgi:hypothetical protein